MFNLKGMRNKAGMTQEQVANKMSVATITYSSWEREKYAISFEQAMQLADIFGCSLDELAGRQHAAEKPSTDETQAWNRVGAAFDAMNHDGREYLADQAENMLKVEAFVYRRMKRSGRRPKDVDD